MHPVNGLTRRWRFPEAAPARPNLALLAIPDNEAVAAGAASDHRQRSLTPAATVGATAERGGPARTAATGFAATTCGEAIGGPLPQSRGDRPAPRQPLVDRILAVRGIGDPAAMREFRTPRLSQLHDPGLLPGVDIAAERLATALRRRERIAIYGDYDVDGITATAILYHLLRAIDPEAVVRCYVPHRIDEGYGINSEALRQLQSEGATVVVSVDCGITAVEPARVARAIGLDLIITDHHHAPADPSELPDALAIVHPAIGRRGICGLGTGDPGAAGPAPYPFPDLCGAGVAFKLAWRLATLWCGSDRVSDRLRTVLLELLPLVALGTIADVVPLLGENRVLASAGLRAIKSSPLPGLQALIRESGLADERIDCEKVGFVLGPRLNACGRLGHAATAVRLLTEATAEESATIAHDLSVLNRDRQRTEQLIVEQACAAAEEQGQTRDDHRAIVLAHEEWHAGVVGIVCSRLVERYGRPTILLQRQGELCKGSARGIDGYSVHAGLEACAALLERFGGHAAAAGLAVRADRLEAFRAAFVAHANAHLSVADLVPTLRIDCDAMLDELDHEAVRALAGLSPFGRSNPRPALLLRNLVVASPPRLLKERHLKLFLRESDSFESASLPRGTPRREIEAIWWNAAAHAALLPRGQRLDAVVDPKVSDWSGRVELELRDVRLHEA